MAQIERWRQAQHMQVERQRESSFATFAGERRTVSNAWEIAQSRG